MLHEEVVNMEAESPLLAPEPIEIYPQCRDQSTNVSPSLENLTAANEQRRPSILRRRSLATIFSKSTQTDSKESLSSSSTHAINTDSAHHQHTTDEKSRPQTPTKNKKMVEKIDVIQNVVGDWGSWQLRTVLLIFLCKIPSAWFMSCIIFTAPAPRHGEFFCKPPTNLSVLPNANATTWVKILHPYIEEADDREFKIDFCNVYQDALDHANQYYKNNNLTHTNPLERPKRRNASIIPCDEFEHHADYTSLITEFDLVCSRDILVAVTQYWHLFGVLCGGILATKLLENISPRNVMLIGMVTQIICGNLTGLVTSYKLHVFFRCLSAVCCCQMYTGGQMIFQDITGGKYRTACTCLFETFWSIGVILLPFVASFWSSWTHLYMAISIPTFALIFLHQWVPDSPRWFLKRNMIKEAKAILIESARVNGRESSLPVDLEYQLQIQAAALIAEPEPAGWWSIWQGPRAIWNMIAVHLSWSIYIVVYYGMLLNIRAFSRDHLEVNTIVAGCCEIIGVLIGLGLIMHTSRKWLWTGVFNICAAVFAYTAWLVPHDLSGHPKVALFMLTAMISKIAISSTLAILTTSTVELVAPEKKKICAYSTIVWARVWLLTAPFVGATIVFGRLVPQTAFATLSIIGGILTASIKGPRTWPKPSMMSKLPPEYTTATAGIWTTKTGHSEKISA